jgi:outer membrane protein
MRTIVSAVLMLVSLSAPGVTRAQESSLMVRLRPVYISPANQSDAIPALSVPKDAIHVSSKVMPELDITYFFNPFLSAELVLTIPQEHEVTLSGTKIGTFSHLPPTLLVQAGLPIGFVRPYLGAGLNLTLITAQNISVPGVGKLTLDDASIGPAAQAGVDFRLGRNWSLNLDVKYAMIGVDVKSGGSRVSEVRVNPWLFGGGLAYRF